MTNESHSQPSRELTYPMDTDPVVAHDTWLEMERRGDGWQLWVSVDGNNPANRAAVEDYFVDLYRTASIAYYGIEGDSHLKAFVDVGPRDKAEYVARNIDHALSPVLHDLDHSIGGGPQGIVGFGSSAKIVGKFRISAWDTDFQVTRGREGVSFLMAADKYLHVDPGSPMSYASSIATYENRAYTEANALLEERYGVYYTGTDPKRAPSRSLWLLERMRQERQGQRSQ